MGEVYEPCGGCGADHPSKRCINCFHDFGGERSTHQNKEGLEAGQMPDDLREAYGDGSILPINWPEVLNSRAAAGYVGDSKGTRDLLRATAVFFSSLSQQNERLRKEEEQAWLAAEGPNAEGQTLAGRIMQHKLACARAEVALSASQAQLKIYREALEPFADAVFNDNGDITVNLSAVDPDDFIAAYFAFRRARTALSQEAGE